MLIPGVRTCRDMVESQRDYENHLKYKEQRGFEDCMKKLRIIVECS